ncbi:MAG: efflux RND transporter permease subunit [Veillonella sp.]
MVHRQLNEFNAGSRTFQQLVWYPIGSFKPSFKLNCYCIVNLCWWYWFSIPFLTNILVPAEDSGHYMIAVNEPPGATSERTITLEKKLSLSWKVKMILKSQKMSNYSKRYLLVAGFDLLGNGQKSSAGVIFATMSDWKYRTTQATSIKAMVGQTFGFAAQGVPEATVVALNPPSIPGLGATGGFSMYIINEAMTAHKLWRNVLMNS